MMNRLNYCPELNGVTGGINATILMMQLEYWFKRTESGRFYKFLEPCEDVNYRVGDSWVEELGFTKAEFRSAFGKIGKVYKSKKEYDGSMDKFEGKFYLSYYDRVRRLTYYLRNDRLIVNKIGIGDGDLCKSSLSISTYEQSESPLSIDHNQSLLQEQDLSMSSELSMGDDGLSVSDRILVEDEELFKGDSVLVKENGSGEIKEVVSLGTGGCTPYEEIKSLFNQTCVHLVPIKHLSHRRKQALDKLWEIVHGKLATIKEVFGKIHENDFLSGRIVGKMWRATFDWIIRQDKFVAIWEGYYNARESKAGTYDNGNLRNGKQGPGRMQPLQSMIGKNREKKRFNRMMTHDWDYNLLEQMEQEYIDNKLGKGKDFESEKI